MPGNTSDILDFTGVVYQSNTSSSPVHVCCFSSSAESSESKELNVLNDMNYIKFLRIGGLILIERIVHSRKTQRIKLYTHIYSEFWIIYTWKRVIHSFQHKSWNGNKLRNLLKDECSNGYACDIQRRRRLPAFISYTHRPRSPISPESRNPQTRGQTSHQRCKPSFHICLHLQSLMLTGWHIKWEKNWKWIEIYSSTHKPADFDATF